MAALRPPTIPIQTNRSLRLRQSSIRGSEMALTAPTQSESSSFVAGQNKAADVNLNRRLNAWYKAQAMVVDKMNRYQNYTYDTYVRLETDKKQLVKYTEQLYGAEQDYNDGEEPLPNHSQPARLHEEPDNKESSHETTSVQRRKGSGDGKGTSLPGINVSSPQPHVITTLKEDTTLVQHLDNGNGEGESNTGTLPNIRGALSDHTPYGSYLVDKNKSKSVSNIPQTLTGPEPPSKKVKTSLDTCSQRPPDHPQNHGKAQHPEISKSEPAKSVTSKKMTGNYKSSESPRRMSEFDVKGRRPDRNFTIYKQDSTGNIIKTELIYKRRDFPKPQEKDVLLFERLLKQEENRREQHRSKLKNLQRNIEKLESWNPLDVLRAMRPKNEPLINKGPVRTMGYLEYMVQAFGSRHDEELLEGMDPNSYEAMELCKYLRRKRPTLTDTS